MMTLFSAWWFSGPAVAATAPDGAECPSMDAMEEYDAQRLELQHVDVRRSVIEATPSEESPLASLARAAGLGTSSTTTSTTVEEGYTRVYRIATGTGRVLTDFTVSERPTDPRAFWEHMALEDEFDATCEPLIGQEAYRTAVVERRRISIPLWAGAGVSGIGALGAVAMASDAKGPTKETRWLVLAGGSTVVAAGLAITGIALWDRMEPPNPNVMVCKDYTLDDFEAEVRNWNRHARAASGCR